MLIAQVTLVQFSRVLQRKEKKKTDRLSEYLGKNPDRVIKCSQLFVINQHFMKLGDDKRQNEASEVVFINHKSGPSLGVGAAIRLR